MASRVEPQIQQRIDALADYHERSKHRLRRYADGPAGLDWANQPNPFREFDGAPKMALPLAADALATQYADVRRGALPLTHAFSTESVGVLLELSLGVSAWKEYGTSRWPLRCNPSSGNLHPTEAYLVCPPLDTIAGGVHHYVSRDHALERRAAIDDARWRAAFAGTGILIGLTSIHWREAWKYGMRAWRYCQHDCGHAIAAIAYAAAALGWQARWVGGASDDAIAALLGLDRDDDFRSAEREAPDVLLWIGEPTCAPDVVALADNARMARWRGHANRLSAEHIEWPDIDSIHRATVKGSARLEPARAVPAIGFSAQSPTDISFAKLARQRRSAVDFDGRTSISASTFYAMLECLLPRVDAPPWNALSTPARVHPAFLVHRVEGLLPGLYVLVRDATVLARVQSSMRDEWLWEKTGPEHLPFYLLLPADLRHVAKTICCHQDIAADSCFALGMICELSVALDAPWLYRLLYWECGMLGHVLYLEAEAAGVRGTGIGCFFDDEMHGLLGIRDNEWQSLYHFTVGGPLEDTRLKTSLPYASIR